MVAALVACGQAAKAPAPPPAPPVEAACATAEWRYALVGSLYTAVEHVTRDELMTAWRAGRIAATDDRGGSIHLRAKYPVDPAQITLRVKTSRR